MRTSIRLMLNKSRKLKDGRYPLVFRVIHRRRKKLLYTGYRVYEKGFDELAEKVLPDEGLGLTASRVLVINKEVEQKKKEISKRVRQLEAADVSYTVDDLLDYNNNENKGSFYLLGYADRQIEDKKAKAKDGMAAAYRSTRMSLAKYIGGHDVPLERVDCRFVQGYIDFLYRKDLASNTVCYYLRNLRALYNQAVSDGFKTTNEYPFTKISTRPAKTVKRAISREEMEAIAGLQFAGNSEMELSRDLYLFSFYAQGMSFVDIVFFKKENIIGETIVYNRHKSKQLIQIVITPQMAQLMRKYEGKSEFVFPIINPDSPQPFYRQYRIALGVINRHLRKMESMLGIQKRITTYTARHTWATLAHDYGAPISVISAGLGHTSEEMTKVYLNELDIKVLNRVNLVITNLSINNNDLSG